MNCRDCRYYAKSKFRCSLGKVNPKTDKKSEEVAALMGWSYICNYNTTKQDKIAEMTNA